jgi:hypothetical protein
MVQLPRHRIVQIEPADPSIGQMQLKHALFGIGRTRALRVGGGAEFVIDVCYRPSARAFMQFRSTPRSVDSESTVIPRLFPILPILGFRSSAHPNDGDAVDEPHRPRPRPVGQ